MALFEERSVSSLMAECLQPEVADEQMQQWRLNPRWREVEPSVEVSNPKGTFCQLDCSAIVALPPADVYALLCDTGNKRVFKNVKGVRNRTVLEDDGRIAVIELELVTGWQFLFFSGEFSVHMRLTQDRPNMKLLFELSKSGFMKHFKGAWSVEPALVPDPEGDTDSVTGGRTVANACGARMASRVCLVQSVQPAVNPPPILSQYLRHIAAKALRDSLGDMQLEAARIRHGFPADVDVKAELKRKGTGVDHRRVIDVMANGA